MATQPLMNVFNRLSVAFEHGEGAWLFDTAGNKYLDALCGIAVTGLGHAHPAVTYAISEQAAKLIHCSNLYTIPKQEELAEKLARISGMDNVFFANSGAEANEAAIKLARRYGHNRNIDNPAIIVMEQSFHGRTLATLSATGNRATQQGFEPLVSGFVRVPFDDVEAVRQVARNNPNVVAILVEPIQGEGGIHIPAADYLNQLREICDEQQWLLMLDEVQTGNGRTGRYFAYQHNGILPDVVTTAKGLGNGFPIGACLARGIAAETLTPGSHGTTYGGNPLACAAALAVVDTIEQDKLCQRAEVLGNHIAEGFRAQLGGAPYVKEIRNKGLMIGIELTEAGSELAVLAKIKGILLNVTGGGRVVRLLPPLIMSDQEADLLVNTVAQLIRVYAGEERDSAN
ncbi:aspartate aminotransferase family protein [Marinobacterium sediminicola]|uniref:Acetylornithine aminotransferase n=1 Tax=Marinobacterium sediminicola TaxID=518898 RepID=A0ABY1RXU1_9GAMM|nr:aspartate aminotransferase family protein [Marinobacterium sediminicola]ULG68599.1 aspartate aminotransferase family protein [Marinobacterium sediminicola]SMR73118.1 acetylornithine aminotransferase [Marinobacterium sediminicola]